MLFRSLFVIFLLIMSGVSSAPVGGLYPPGPPVMPTRSLVEPRIPITTLPTEIEQPGSYYLVQNLHTDIGTGILVTSDNVTIDLNGFTLSGGVSSETGILFPSTASIESTVVHSYVFNGLLKGWGEDGINGTYLSISHLHVSECGGTGIRISNGFASECLSTDNGGHGFYATSTHLVDCTANFNGLFGFGGTVGNTLRNCKGSANDEFGIRVGQGGIAINCISSFNIAGGFASEVNSSIIECVSRLNDGDGYILSQSSSLTDSLSIYNDGHGVRATGHGVRITGCTIVHSSDQTNPEWRGIRIDGRTVVNDTTVNGYHGGIEGKRARIESCDLYSYGSAHGIHLTEPSQIINCQVETEQGSISVGDHSVIEGCKVSAILDRVSNPTESHFGIELRGNNNQTVRNNFLNCGTALVVSGEHNLIHSNTFADVEIPITMAHPASNAVAEIVELGPNYSLSNAHANIVY